MTEGAQCREVGRHGVIREEAPHDLRQPSSLLGNGLMHPPSQPLLDLAELCPHAITPGSPFEEELAPTRLTADVDEPQELEGLRFSKPAPSASVRRMATNSIRRVFSGLSDLGCTRAGSAARHLDAGRLVPLLVELISEDNGGGPERAE
jgi:hypothetical protein